MKILAVNGSPRQDGNTDIVLEWVLDELGKKEAEAHKVYAARRKVSGCLECFTCQKQVLLPGCALKDDMQDIYEAIMASDVLILASPVFCWGVTSHLKAILDRCYALFKFSQDPYVSLLANQKMALIITSGGGQDDGASACEQMYTNLVSFAQANNLGTFLATNLTEPANTKADAELEEQARAFARDLAEKA